MESCSVAATQNLPPGQIWLAFDTCDVAGSVAVGRWNGLRFEILMSHAELEGQNSSSTLISTVSDPAVRPRVCNGRRHGCRAQPRSFTGIRIGTGTVRGLAEGSRVPVVTVTRLEVIATKAGAEAALKMPTEQEVFLRLRSADSDARELSGRSR